MTPVQAATMVSWLASKYPSHKLTDANSQAYAEELLDLTIEEARAGLKSIVRNCKFFPSIAEVFEHCRPRPMTGLEAWGKVEEVVRKFGRYQNPEFSDPVIKEAVRLFGWETICNSQNEEVDRAHFSKLYEACRQRLGQQATSLPALPQNSSISILVAGIGNGGGV